MFKVMNHRFQPEFCLRNYRSYFLIRNLSLSLTANSVTQARHKKPFFFFSLRFLPISKSCGRGTNMSNGTALWNPYIQQTAQGQGFFKVKYVVTAAGQDQSGLESSSSWVLSTTGRGPHQSHPYGTAGLPAPFCTYGLPLH